MTACGAICWPFPGACATVSWPSMAAVICAETSVPNSSNSGIPTYWTPGTGCGETPGWVILTESISERVSGANALAAARYCGFWYVEVRVPGGTAAQPFFDAS